MCRCASLVVIVPHFVLWNLYICIIVKTNSGCTVDIGWGVGVDYISLIILKCEVKPVNLAYTALCGTQKGKEVL